MFGRLHGHFCLLRTAKAKIVKLMFWKPHNKQAIKKIAAGPKKFRRSYVFLFCQNKLCPNIGKMQYSNFIHPPSPLETTRISCHGQTDKTPIFLLLPLDRFFLQIFLLYYNQHLSLFAFCVPSCFSSCVPPLPLRKNIEFNAKKMSWRECKLKYSSY